MAAPPQLPFTELPNELTKELDVVSVPEMFASLSSCDDQLFSGWGPEGEKKSIYSEEMIETLEAVIEKMVPVCARALSGDKKMAGTIQVGGCGTSGRLAFFICEKYNQILEKGGFPPIFQYLIAGGDRALVTAVEQAEDVPTWGKNDLHLEEGKEDGVPRVYFGVSCGLSAAYVAGQLFGAREDERYVCVSAIGFNPVELGKEAPLCCEGKNTSFYEIINEMATEQKEKKKESNSFVINPIVGPEGITGSTRMKGGTMTKIILDILFFSSLMKALEVSSSSPLCPPLRSLLELYQQGVKNSYIALGEKNEGEAESRGERALKLVKEALTRGGEGKKDGKVYYVADCYSSGVVGLIDASECPPTFGAKRDDFGCFMSGGFDTMALSASSPLRTDTILNVDLSTLLEKAKAQQFAPSDLIVILQQSPTPSSPLLSALSTLHSISSPPPTVLIKPTSSPSSLDSLSSIHIQIPAPSSSLSPPHADSFAACLWEGGVGGEKGGLGGGVGEVSLKVVLNVLSTLGHVLVGKVAGNRMIDVAVSNNKLYYRAVRIIGDVGRVDAEEAERCLMRSVFGVDELGEGAWAESVEKRIERAQKRKRVTPRAILLARKCQTVAEADALLLKEPIVRKLF